MGLALLGSPVSAGELVYRPINPSFGGNPMNGSFLLGLAQAQNDHKAEDTGLRSLSRDPLQDFTRQITSRLLSRVSAEIADRIYGENAEDSGNFRIQDTIIAYERVGGVVKLNIVDAATGNSTVIEIPAPSF